MNKATGEINELKAENKKLKKKIQRLKRESIIKSDTEFLLSFLIPESEEQWEFETFIDLNCPYLTFSELLKVVTLLLKLNRTDLAVLICETYISKNYIVGNENNNLEFEQLLNDFINEIFLLNEIEPKQINILFTLMTYESKKPYISVYKNAYEKYMDFILKISLTEKNDYWLRKILFDVFTIDIHLFFKYSEYLNGHWAIIYDWITEDTLEFWEVFSSISKNENLIKKVEKRKEDFHVAKNGVIISHISYRDSNEESNNKLDSDTLNKWKDESELKSFGYKVSNKTDEQRRGALDKAIKYMPISKIVSHIEWLLRNSYNKHDRVGDFSKAIRAYESDLEYLKRYFNS